jgi:Tfp pilus assembly protein PilF
VTAAGGQNRSALSITYQAKIVLDGGLALPTTPLVIPKHEGRVLWDCRVESIFGNGNVVYRIFAADTIRPPDTVGGIPDDCLVTVRLEGYETVDITLHDKTVVVLKRAGAHEGSLVSMPSLTAPPEAKKAYERGVSALAKRRWLKAQKHFERAVAIWPRYAPAWTDLGETYRAESKPPEAREAYERAMQADPRYARAFLLAARLALDERRMEDGLRLSEAVLAINPIEYPEAHFYRGVANYNLKRLDEAEKSIRRAMELDTTHRLPRAERLLGFVLASEGEYRPALEHLRNYVKISPLASDVIETLELIQALEIISSGG